MTRAPWKGRLRTAILCFAAILGAAAPSLAQQPTPVPTPEATPAPEASPSPTPEPTSIAVSGFVDIYYGYNLNGVDPIARSFDIQHNTFSLSLGEVALTKGVTPESRLGFRVDLDFGKTADLVAAYEPGTNGVEINKNIMQAYGSLLTGKVQWDMGKFVTPHGAEVIESQDNWNYTRSILFGYAIPFYHLGLRATVPVSDTLTVAGYLVNGWNNSSEINGNKTFALSATIKPSAKFTWVANYMIGKETPGSEEYRKLLDTTLTLLPAQKFSLMANFDYGTEGEVSWWGIAGYAKLQPRPSWALVGRYEYVDDSDGGFMTFGTKLQSLTATSENVLVSGLKLRLEYRTDFADEAIFPKDDGTLTASQTTFTLGLVYAFGGSF